MESKYTENAAGSGAARLEAYDAPFGATRSHVHKERGIAVGSNIVGGVFVSYSPTYIEKEFGSITECSIIVPDLSGESLVENDRSTSFAGTIGMALKDGAFKFVGVTHYSGESCKPDCAPAQCCPFGYPDDSPQSGNYVARLGKVSVVTQGPVRVNNISDVSVLDELHVVVAQIDGEDCRNFGAVTNAADAGTQPLAIDYRIMESAGAGQGVWIELGRN